MGDKLSQTCWPSFSASRLFWLAHQPRQYIILVGLPAPLAPQLLILPGVSNLMLVHVPRLRPAALASFTRRLLSRAPRTPTKGTIKTAPARRQVVVLSPGQQTPARSAAQAATNSPPRHQQEQFSVAQPLLALLRRARAARLLLRGGLLCSSSSFLWPCSLQLEQ